MLGCELSLNSHCSVNFQILTRDSVTVAVDAVVYFRIYNATISITNVENANRSTRLLAQTTLRNVLGTKNLSEILMERENISTTMQVNSRLEFYMVVVVVVESPIYPPSLQWQLQSSTVMSILEFWSVVLWDGVLSPTSSTPKICR